MEDESSYTIDLEKSDLTGLPEDVIESAKQVRVRAVEFKAR
jgi:hypothetical protein